MNAAQCAHMSSHGQCAAAAAPPSRFCYAHACPKCGADKAYEASHCPAHGDVPPPARSSSGHSATGTPRGTCRHASRHGLCDSAVIPGTSFCEAHTCPVCRGDKMADDAACAPHLAGSPSRRCRHVSGAQAACSNAAVIGTSLCQDHTCSVCKRDKNSHAPKCASCSRPSPNKALFSACKHHWQHWTLTGVCSECSKPVSGSECMVCSKCRAKAHERCTTRAPPPAPLLDGVPVPVTVMGPTPR